MAQRCILVLLCLACLAPFGGKAFHIDDPLFVWSAAQIRLAPLDFFGSQVNWFGSQASMFEVIHNPPGFPFLLAAWTSIFGTGEAAHHWAVFLIAAVAALGVYDLARTLGGRPLFVATLVVLSPVFLVSATTVMCDLLMFALWVWSVALWVRGVHGKAAWPFAAATLCVCLATLSKYFAMSLIPLLLVYALVQNRRSRAWAVLLALPVLALFGYDAWTEQLYGQGLLGLAVVAPDSSLLLPDATWISRGITALSFAGGCFIALALFLPWLWNRRALVGATVGYTGLVAGLIVVGQLGNHLFRDAESGTRWLLVLQVALFLVAGLHLLALAVDDLRRRRDADALLLTLWILGTLAFATVPAQFVAARTLLCLVPPAAILIDRRMRQGVGLAAKWVWAPLLVCAAIALAATGSDYRLAGSVRRTAEELVAELSPRSPRPVWFEGHWGFQYYMEAGGAQAIDFADSKFLGGDIIVVPANNTNLQPIPAPFIASSLKREATAARWISTMNESVGAGFYSEIWGPAPYVFAPVPPESYLIYRVRELSP